jgi:hypothetical protein
MNGFDLLGHIDDATPALADLLEEFVPPDPVPDFLGENRKRSPGAGCRAGGTGGRAPGLSRSGLAAEKQVGLFLRGEQLIQALAQLSLPPTGRIEKYGALAWICQIPCRFEKDLFLVVHTSHE